MAPTSATATAQINVRLDKQLKEAGDTALAELGLTPSVAVRALWEQAAQRGKGIQAIAPLLLGNVAQLKLLICADVWVALLEGGQLGSDRDDAQGVLAADTSRQAQAQQLLRQARAAGAQLLYPATALKDVFASLEAAEDGQGTDGGAWEGVDRMRDLATAVGVDEADLMLACRYRGLTGNLAGNMALAAAERAKVDYLVTFDEELLRRSTVAALSPQDMCAVLGTRA